MLPVDSHDTSFQSGKSYWHGIVTVSSDDSVRGAFEKLVKNNILSAPVRSAAHVDEQAVHDHSTYGGFVGTQSDVWLCGECVTKRVGKESKHSIFL